ncbi:hypothetical protein LPTSP4_06920 [Leptospira ryugenii]|uniref:Iron-containing redox enzyme family protein n=1 Tax=Leptospira ryugenii TaxID=1917863 RepID=A0A2P2DX47_9LEPT|nr:iron-containing redox enzyme family protein [Leptospira ryugenii]GBF49182.1 hypothetical protein LPTSP4_06920 [Leptospira ryugenii]
MSLFVESLKVEVRDHFVLKHPWLLAKSESMGIDDLRLWLSQEYFVSIGFIDWFLRVASLTKNQSAKIVLVENIWEELGEGKLEETHVSILTDFLKKLDIDVNGLHALPETKEYLGEMEEIIGKSFFYGLGALGPANEYLLKLEYAKISNAYFLLKKDLDLPEGKFFQVNLDADEGHSKRLFNLIDSICISESEKAEVIKGNRLALQARVKFYDGLERIRISTS